MMRIVPVLAIVAGVVLLAWFGWTFYVLFSTERLRYQVLEKKDTFEIRGYGPHIVAYVDVPGDYETAINEGFRILAGYIFGGNTRRERISMTAPVTESRSERIAMTAPVTEQVSGGLRRISFMMPSRFTLATLPQPNDVQVRFEQVPAKKYAVTRFTWYAAQGRVERKKLELSAAVKSAGLIQKAPPTYAGYNDPYSFPFLQHHEILIEIQ
jgi:hypothetical protein